MPTLHQYVVCYGSDHLLLKARRQLLEQAGYTAVSTSDMLTVAKWLVASQVRVLVLCHTLSAEEANIISRFHHELHSTAAILCLGLGEAKPAPESCVQSCDAQKGSAAFLAAVSQISTGSAISNRTSQAAI